MKKNNIIAIVILILLCITYSIKVIEQNDTFYLIKIGEYISNNGIDLMDHFSWIPNLSYTYPHWLYSLFIYFIYNNFGFTGVHISTICVYIVIILSIYYVVLKICKNNFLAFFTSFISIMVLRAFIIPRAQSISIILFFWEVYFIHNIIKTGNKKYILYLALDSLLIANIHGTVWMMTFILYLPFIVSHIIYLLIKKKNINFKLKYRIIIEKIDNFKLLLISFVISFLMGLLTPSKICYTYIFRTMLGVSQSYIQEHAPLVIIQAPLLIVILFLLYFSKRKVKLYEFFMISGLLIMSFISARHLIFLYTIGFIYLSKLLNEELNERNDKTFKLLDYKLFNNKLGSIFSLIIPLIICVIVLNLKSQKSFIKKSDYPVDAVNYIKENLDYKNLRIFNHYDIGSYLIFNDIKVFIDSRADLYLKEFGNNNIFNDGIDVMTKFNYEEIFNKYNINYALLYTNEPLNYIIKSDEKYTKIYEDQYFTIYENTFEEENEKKI